MITSTIDAVDAYGAYLAQWFVTAPVWTYVFLAASLVGCVALWRADDTDYRHFPAPDPADRTDFHDTPDLA